jgi:prepilin-type N-terminal cleavage/methylation domain-containing protein/prepilin-type processing-associated H-X9-DG protein
MRSRRRAGLTLIEVIVATAIVGILMALALPGLHTVRESARGARCSSNLRQMGAAALMYSSSNREAMPAAILYTMSDAGLRTQMWDVEVRADGSMRPGPIWAYTDAPPTAPEEIFRCPSFDAPALSATNGAEPFAGYNYNTTYIGAEGRFPELGVDGRWRHGWANARHGVPPAAHHRTDRTALFGDAGWKGGANRFMRAPSADVEQDLGIVYAGGQAFRHRGCAHVVFLDGHVRPHDRCCEGVHATPDLLEQVMGAPHNGFLSDDDSLYDPR